MLSEPERYMITHILIVIVMALYYSVCSWRVETAFLIITAFLHVVVFLILLVLGFRDPGIIPKILG